jgi:hypothetical protein
MLDHKIPEDLKDFHKGESRAVFRCELWGGDDS